MGSLNEKTGAITRKMGSVYMAMKRSDTPLYAKLACGLCVRYALSPIDLIPDFIPVLGAVDDFIILPFLIWLAVKLIPAEIMAECQEQADEIWREGGQTKKRYALVTLAIWLILLMWVVHILKKYFI